MIPVVNLVNRFMMTGDSKHTIAYDADTGLYPAFDTVDGTREYDAPDNCRKVAAVLVSRDDYSTVFNSSLNYSQTVEFGESYYSITNIKSRFKTLTENAKIIFPVNPGNTDDIYLLKYYIEPTNISSINIQVDVPPDGHWRLIDGCVARIQSRQYGKNDAWRAWMDETKLEWFGELNDVRPRGLHTMRRPC